MMPYEEDYKTWLEEALIRMDPDWVCDEMSENEFAHNWCHQYCGEDDAYITPKCLHMYYHHIARADRKTEQMEIKGSKRLLKGSDEPQTDEHCNTCRHKDECEGATYEYKNTEWWCLAYAPIDEPQTERSE